MIGSNARLFALCVAIWGTTWIAITFQLGKVAAAPSIAYRFLLAASVLFGVCFVRRLPLAFDLRRHALLALQGVLLFGIAYLFVYRAEALVVSGLVAVGYSASPLLNMLGVRAVYGTPIDRRVAYAGVLGVAGIALVFWPQLAHVEESRAPLLGALFTMAAVLSSAGGSVTASANARLGLSVWAALAWGTLYGGLFSIAAALFGADTLAFDLSPAYVLSLFYLAIPGSVIAFACYLILLERLGAARAGYIGVMVPIVALIVSTLFEGFRWQISTFLGVALCVTGNILILRRGPASRPTLAATSDRR